MSRKHKFRIWDGEKITVLDWYLQDAHTRRIYVAMFTDALLDENLKLMQYIGIKDKNGRDIYGNDIVRYKLDFDGMGWGTVEIKYFGDGNYPAFDIDNDEFVSNGISAILAEGEIEVIGNIYENKELLEQ